MADDIFQEVPEGDIPKVLTALKRDWPNHFILYQIITITKDLKSDLFQHTLYIHGDYNNGVYLSILHDKVQLKDNLYLDTLSSDLTQLSTCLQNTQVISWQTMKFEFFFINSRFRKIIQDVMTCKGLQCFINITTLFWYPPDKDLETRMIPDDVFLDFLDGTYAEEINNNWHYKTPGSDMTLKEIIEKNFGIGLFRKSDKKLLSSALSDLSGIICVLYTEPEARGKGYAPIVVEHIVRENRRRGIIPFATIIVGNTPSETMFNKFGFVPIYEADYIWDDTKLTFDY